MPLSSAKPNQDQVQIVRVTMKFSKTGQQPFRADPAQQPSSAYTCKIMPRIQELIHTVNIASFSLIVLDVPNEEQIL